MSASSRPRGRPPRPEPAQQIGYRATEDIRRHIDVAKGFLGLSSQQAVVDAAVTAYLTQLRNTNGHYADAAAALDRQLADERGNVRSLPSKKT